MQLNPFVGQYLAEPALTWRALLDTGPDVAFADDLGMWVISRHELVRRALGDAEAFSNALTLAPVYQPCPEALAVLAQLDVPPTTIGADAPIHTRTRQALRATFANTPTRVDQEYGAVVRRRVDELVSRLAAGDSSGDLVEDIAAELPLLVILDLLGVPPEDVARIRGWVRNQVALLWGNPGPREQVELAERLVAFWRYCQELVRRREDEGAQGADFVARALRHRQGSDEVLTLDEVASLVFNLLIAGQETTAGLLGRVLERALTTPRAWVRLGRDPAWAAPFVEETLRFGPPIDGWLRVTTRPVTLGETMIPAGSRCLLLLGAANRDLPGIAAPDEFDPDRADGRDHLAFGYGPHFCVGAALARLEAQVVLQRLAAALPQLRSVPGRGNGFRPNLAIRAHALLPVVAPAGRDDGLADAAH